MTFCHEPYQYGSFFAFIRASFYDSLAQIRPLQSPLTAVKWLWGDERSRLNGRKDFANLTSPNKQTLPFLQWNINSDQFWNCHVSELRGLCYSSNSSKGRWCRMAGWVWVWVWEVRQRVVWLEEGTPWWWVGGWDSSLWPWSEATSRPASTLNSNYSGSNNSGTNSRSSSTRILNCVSR